ncbi:MAG: hypothetical protein HFJ49_03150 [Clostridia bacterium]|jgi:hypothetical protein|nr:hypothetical protein [Clostridia bacterium]
MSLAFPGLIHCENCGRTLGIHEFGICDNCKNKQKQEKKAKENEALRTLSNLTQYELQGLIELAKEKSKEIRLKEINSKINKLQKEKENL